MRALKAMAAKVIQFHETTDIWFPSIPGISLWVVGANPRAPVITRFLSLKIMFS